MKRGQITLYMIIGIVMLAVFVFLSFIAEQNQDIPLNKSKANIAAPIKVNQQPAAEVLHKDTGQCIKNCGDYICQDEPCKEAGCICQEDSSNCIYDCMPSRTCSDSDKGWDYYKAGTVTGPSWGKPGVNHTFMDSCSGKMLQESVCTMDYEDNMSIVSFTSFECPVACEAGRCINESAGTCADSDNGAITVKGTATNARSSITDRCGTNSDDEKNTLIEYSCEPDGSISSALYNCKCKGGACESAPAASCTDSDGGRNYNLKGIVNIGAALGPLNEIIIEEYEDRCIDDNSISEIYCQDGLAIQEGAVDCPNGCRDGACIP